MAVTTTTVEDLLDLSTVMSKLGIKRDAVMRLIRSGQLEGYKVGPQWRFKPSDVDAFLNAVKFRVVVKKQFLKSTPICRPRRSLQTSNASANRYM